MASIIQLLLFPGLLFLIFFSFLLEFIDRKACARMQNRIGPPWYQPLADFLKLLGKKAIIPRNVNALTFKALPIITLAAVASAFACVPIWGNRAISSFEGDLVVVLYLLTIPTICLFLAGWNSRDVYSITGAFRTLTQMFAYEVPLFLLFLSPSILAGTWSISGIMSFYAQHPQWALFNIPAFLASLIAAQNKLERPPFDAPEAETEVVGGALLEYSGRYLAIFRMAADSELVVVSSIIAALFLPFQTGIIWLNFLLYLAKIMLLVLISAAIKVSMARLRIDQIMRFCWMVLTPIALVQIIFNLIIRGGLSI